MEVRVLWFGKLFLGLHLLRRVGLFCLELEGLDFEDL